jgi:glycosyltransferase involved in cell wall biosynthesis
MPLPEDPWANGKCGLKALQYMALEIPSVISPVGVNQIIIQDGVNGFLCRSTDDWMKVLTRLVADSTLRKQVGQAGRDTVIKTYSVKANAEIFLSLFQR